MNELMNRMNRLPDHEVILVLDNRERSGWKEPKTFQELLKVIII